MATEHAHSIGWVKVKRKEKKTPKTWYDSLMFNLVILNIFKDNSDWMSPNLWSLYKRLMVFSAHLKSGEVLLRIVFLL